LKARIKTWLIAADGSSGTRFPWSALLVRTQAARLKGKKPGMIIQEKTSIGWEGTLYSPLFVGQVLPDGTTRLYPNDAQSLRNGTNEVNTFSVTAGGTTLLRTNVYVYDPNGIDLLAQTNALAFWFPATSSTPITK